MPDTSYFSHQVGIVEKEADKLTGVILHFDDISFKIKGLTVTVWAIIVGWSARNSDARLALLALPVVVVLWCLDGLFKSYQRRTMVRMSIIEQYLNSSGIYEGRGLKEAFESGCLHGDFVVHDPICKWGRTNPKVAEDYQRQTSYLGCMRTPEVMLLYLSLLVFSIVAILVLALTGSRLE